ncbi:phosphotyrosyl phosphatase activator [Westerdykella ornata]|uniref:Serine/threonine-protein phosphatase 2A activator n=1 Tax=Westerdykella ornata TaxID=318751 RepID=A0A6A6JG10_WESOR|nr:phosphotyrosyl phosphatase activator [Westerdykella ornata]KAF2275481.1 phosphotyrosyl phosphatase activator [Westerdykella ornata]
MASTSTAPRTLKVLDRNAPHEFVVPVKRINDARTDLPFFLASKAYSDIVTFIFQLNAAMFPRKGRKADDGREEIKEWDLSNPDVPFPKVIQRLAGMIERLRQMIEEAPPDPGPRRFGNISFRKWHDMVTERLPEILKGFIDQDVLSIGAEGPVRAEVELMAYLTGSFGSPQRLDYGTGHELNFLAFLGCLWKLGAFPDGEDGSIERAIVLGVIEPYLELVRRLILTYSLEPAGSHGVWGLDDHSFLPYIFGSAQYSPAISSPDQIPLEGSLPNAPAPGEVVKANTVERERRRNMYFGGIGFIYDVKKGPFWEHSPTLYDISGVKAGWAKINRGMLKMYHGEVLSRFPVVQHFPMGSLFVWERDPEAAEVTSTIHISSQPPRAQVPTAVSQPQRQPQLRNRLNETVSTPTSKSTLAYPTQGPNVPSGPNQPTRAPWARGGDAAQPPLHHPGPGQDRLRGPLSQTPDNGRMAAGPPSGRS